MERKICISKSQLHNRPAPTVGSDGIHQLPAATSKPVGSPEVKDLSLSIVCALLRTVSSDAVSFYADMIFGRMTRVSASAACF